MEQVKKNFLTLRIILFFSKKFMWVWDPGSGKKTYPGSRVKKAPDPGFTTLNTTTGDLLMLYCSRPGWVSPQAEICRAISISVAPPPAVNRPSCTGDTSV
jgi:hypothetical protein